MRFFTLFMLSFFLFLGISCQSHGKREKADLVLFNGNIWTVNTHEPWVESVAVKGDRILEVGLTEAVLKLAGDSTQRVDLKGAFVLPGFIDSHTHFLDGGISLSRIQLRDAGSRNEFIQRIKEKARQLGQGKWILDGNWDHQQFDPPEMPRKEWIDPVTPDNPVCVNRHDGHMVLANSAALKVAGITKNSISPLGGDILKDHTTGEATGILKDAAIGLVMQHVPEQSLEEKETAAELALRHACQYGITSIHDMANMGNFEVYQRLLKENKLTARIFVYIPVTEVDIYARSGFEKSFRDDFLKIGGLKGFVDGSLGSATALFFEPYTDEPSNSGLLFSHMLPEGIMKKRLLQADRAGFQAAVHAIGDKANHIILDIFEEIMAENGQRNRRWRIEHAQHLLPEDCKRIGRLGVIASVQPYHAIDDGCWAEKKIGKNRAANAYAFKSLLDQGAILAFGSDWTVAPLNPILGIYAAVTRQTLDGKDPLGWFPEQKIPLEEAIKGYTLNGAYTEFSEHAKGSVEKGKLADLVVLTKNLFEIPPDKIRETEVQLTIFNGKIVYRKQ